MRTKDRRQLELPGCVTHTLERGAGARRKWADVCRAQTSGPAVSGICTSVHLTVGVVCVGDLGDLRPKWAKKPLKTQRSPKVAKWRPLATFPTRAKFFGDLR